MVHGSCVYCHREKGSKTGYCIVTGEEVNVFAPACKYHNETIPKEIGFKMKEDFEEKQKRKKVKK